MTPYIPVEITFWPRSFCIFTTGAAKVFSLSASNIRAIARTSNAVPVALSQKGKSRTPAKAFGVERHNRKPHEEVNKEEREDHFVPALLGGLYGRAEALL